MAVISPAEPAYRREFPAEVRENPLAEPLPRPTLRGLVPSELPDGVNAAYEIVIDGFTLEAVSHAMKVGLHAACGVAGVRRVTAGNYGGKLGKFHIPLRDLIEVG